MDGGIPEASAVTLRHVSKRFDIYDRPADLMLEALTGRQRHHEFWAIKDVSLEVPRGSVLGILGRNGAGKSTLLKMIAGTLSPTSGEVAVRGKVSAILELGTGFHPDRTGRDNVIMGGLCLGMSRDEITRRLDDIIDFAELRAFIDQPFRTYSSGMQARLTFAVATSVDPEVLIIDEALAVGDARFQLKSFDRVREFRRRGKSILLVSHDINQVVTISDHAILLERGEVIASGDPNRVGNTYHELLFAPDGGRSGTRTGAVVDRHDDPVRPAPAGQEAVTSATVRCEPYVAEISAAHAPPAERNWQETATTAVVPSSHTTLGGTGDTSSGPEKENGQTASVREHRYGNASAIIMSVEIRDRSGQATQLLRISERYIITCRVCINEPLDDVVFGILVRDTQGSHLFGWDARCGGLEVTDKKLKSRNLRVGSQFDVKLQFRNNLTGGTYFLTVALAKTNTEKLDMRLDALEFSVQPTPMYFTASKVNLEVQPVEMDCSTSGEALDLWVPVK